MAIKKIHISNFKSFDDVNIELRNFNLLIGANASGKSNFIQIFRFLRNIIQHGLDNAISLQSGVEYFRNINIGSSNDFLLEIVSDSPFQFGIGIREKLIGIRPNEIAYKIAIKFNKKRLGFEVAEEKTTCKCDFSLLDKKSKKYKEKENYGPGEIVIYADADRKIKTNFYVPKEIKIKEESIFPLFLRDEKLNAKTTLLERLAFLPPFKLGDNFGNVSIYDFDPKLPKRAVSITGKAELEEDGNNLAIVLKNIMQNSSKKRKFYNLIRELLPFVDNFGVDKFADTLIFKVREVYSKKRFLAASLMSDGTINLTALIIALYFENKLLKIIEESERNIHPYLISKVANMIQEASKKTQIICTTHNPEMLKHVDVNNIFLISRNKDGFSRIFRPIEKEEVQLFLKNELGIDELYVRNLLGM